MYMLFTAKWNVPQAAQAMGLTNTELNWNAIKVQFAEHCRTHPPTFSE
jgi:hypothetical protein